MTDRRIAIHPLGDDDLRVMVALWKRSGLLYKPRGRDKMEALKAQRRRSPDLFLGAFLDKRLVGAVIASDDGRRGWINRLATSPEARGKGVAKALVKAAEDALRRRGRHLFCIHVEDDNQPSIRLFEAIGFTREKEILYYTKRERKSY